MAVFHLNNKEAKRELNVNFNNETLPFCSAPKYIGVTLDRSLTYRRHLESLRKKLTSRVALLRRLAGSGWDAGAKTLRTATLALVHSTTEYCALVCAVVLIPALLTPPSTTPCEKWLDACVPTPADNLPILAGIQPAELRRRGATPSLGRRAMEPGHLLHLALTRPSGAAARRLKSRHPIVPAAQKLISFSDNNNIGAAQWEDHQWNAEWADNPTRLRTLIPDNGTHTHPEWPSREEPGSCLTASAPMSDVCAPACTNGVCPPLRPVSVAQNKTSMSSSTVQSIGLPTDYTAWRFWTMRQPNGFSTPAPISRRASGGQNNSLKRKKKNHPWHDLFAKLTFSQHIFCRCVLGQIHSSTCSLQKGFSVVHKVDKDFYTLH